MGSLRLHLFAALALFLSWAQPALAAVEISFYSRELGGNNFPHAFVHMTGTLPGGERIDQAVGFTAKTVTPAILLGSVAGEVVVEPPSMIQRSDRQFTLALDEARYRAVQAVVQAWRSRRQPSYNLNRRNCVHFVAELAQAAGLRVEQPANLMKRPRSFLQHIRTLNAQAVR